MKRIVALAAAVLVFALTATPAPAQVLPDPPPVPPTPEELQPLLELIAVPGGAVTEPGCAALGTLLGLGVVVIPGLPGTIEGNLGLPVPEELQPELLTATNYLLYVQGTGCGLLPLAAERTVCSVDEQLLAPLDKLHGIEPPRGLPVNPIDLVPEPVAPAGVLVDTVRILARRGVPGAAEVVAALEEQGGCELRDRSPNIEPPPPPPTTGRAGAAPAPITTTTMTTPTPDPPQTGQSAAGSGQESGATPEPPTNRQAVEQAAPIVTTSALDDTPAWLLVLAALALIWLIQTSLRPRDDRLA